MSSSLWNKPVDDITFEDVVAFCADRRAEGVALEYKARFSDKNPVKQIAKEVCAFANTRGGLIFFGVEESGERRPVEKPTGQDLGNDPRAEILSACNEIWPPPAVEVSGFLANPDDPGKGFVVVNIPPSMAAPHAVESGTRVYIRRHDRSEPDGERFTEVDATISEIEHLLDQRRQLQTLQRQRVDYSIDCMRRAMGVKPTDPALFVAIGPVFGFEPRLTDIQCYRLASMPSCDDRPYSLGGYSISLGLGEAWCVDRWGNVIAAQRLSPLAAEPPVHVVRLQERGRLDLFERAGGGKLRVIFGEEIAKPVYRAIGIACDAISRDMPFEPVEVRAIVDRVDALPIVPTKLQSESVADCVYDSAAEEAVAVELQGRLSPPGDDLYLGILRRLFWAWGCPDGKAVNAAARAAVEELQREKSGVFELERL